MVPRPRPVAIKASVANYAPFAETLKSRQDAETFGRRLDQLCFNSFLAGWTMMVPRPRPAAVRSECSQLWPNLEPDLAASRAWGEQIPSLVLQPNLCLFTSRGKMLRRLAGALTSSASANNFLPGWTHLVSALINDESQLSGGASF